MLPRLFCSIVIAAVVATASAFQGPGLPLAAGGRHGAISARRPALSAARMSLGEDVGRRDALSTGTVAAFGVLANAVSPGEARAEGDVEIAVMKTTAGEMVFEFWPEVAPKTVDNFKKLAKTGYFDGQAFHRVIKGFVIQGGDPNSKKGYGPDGTLKGADPNAVRKWGTGGPGYNIKAEFNERKHEFGVLSMARSQDPDSAGSQFFVCLGNLKSLDNKYTTFGKMIKGDDVLQKIGSCQTVRGDYPVERQGIESVTIMPK